MRVEHEGGTAAWLAWKLVAPRVQGHRLPPLQELWPYQSLFLSLVAGDQKASLASLSPRHLEGSLAWGPSLLFRCQAQEGPLWLGSYSVDRCVRHLKGQPGWGPTL